MSNVLDFPEKIDNESLSEIDEQSLFWHYVTSDLRASAFLMLAGSDWSAFNDPVLGKMYRELIWDLARKAVDDRNVYAKAFMEKEQE